MHGWQSFKALPIYTVTRYYIAMDLKTRITGLKEIDRVFLNMPKSTRRKALRPAGREGAKVMKNMATANIISVTSGESTGLLQRSLRVYSLRQYRGMLRYAVMVKRGLVNQKKMVRGVPVRVGLYASVLEYGKKNQPPRSWARKAAREGVTPVFLVVRKTFARNIEAAVRDAKI